MNIISEYGWIPAVVLFVVFKLVGRVEESFIARAYLASTLGYRKVDYGDVVRHVLSGSHLGRFLSAVPFGMGFLTVLAGCKLIAEDGLSGGIGAFMIVAGYHLIGGAIIAERSARHAAEERLEKTRQDDLRTSAYAPEGYPLVESTPEPRSKYRPGSDHPGALDLK